MKYRFNEEMAFIWVTGNRRYDFENKDHGHVRPCGGWCECDGGHGQVRDGKVHVLSPVFSQVGVS